jgi:hypothetical protein
MLGNAAREGVRALHSVITRRLPPDERFAGELNIWDLAGFIYGKHLYGAVHRQRAEPAVRPNIQCKGEGVCTQPLAK